jgi:hypothetical protein
MSGSDAIPVIIGAAIGAGGAVLAQATASFFSSRHDRTRLAWERQRQEREWEIRSEERFLAEKQQLYSEFASLASHLVAYARAIVRDESPFRQPNPDTAEFRRVVAVIRMLAPGPVSAQVEWAAADIETAAYMADLDAAIDDDKEVALEDAEKAWREAFNVLKADLLGGKPGATDKAVEQPM